MPSATKSKPPIGVGICSRSGGSWLRSGRITATAKSPRRTRSFGLPGGPADRFRGAFTRCHRAWYGRDRILRQSRLRKRDEPARVGVVLHDGLELLDAGPERSALSRWPRACCRRARGSRSRMPPVLSPSPAGPWQPPGAAARPPAFDAGAGRRARSPAPPLDRDYRSVSALRPRHRTRSLRSSTLA